jgi:hypothetical protein
MRTGRDDRARISALKEGNPGDFFVTNRFLEKLKLFA